MHPVLRIGAAIVAAGLCVAAGGEAQAEDKLSVGFGFGYKIDANRLGQTISTDGLDAAAPTFNFLPSVFELPDGTLPESTFLDQSVIYPENTLVVFEDVGRISDLEQGGAMVAFDLNLNLRYDFLGFLFVRTGFNYNFRGLGGETTWKSDQDGDGSFTDEHLQKWDYSAWAIPLYLGVNAPIDDGKYNLYFGVGAAYGSGGFTLELKAPAGWYTYAANVGDVDPDAVAFERAPDGSDPSYQATPAEAIDEKASIEGSAIGLGWVLGADAEFTENLGAFVEMETQYIAKMSAAVAFSDPESARVFGSPKLAYPAIPGGQIIRLGIKYTFLTM